jgi:lambda family phage tail tape measure protein
MRLPVEELTRVSDVFIQTITSSNTNMEMMAESFKYASPLAAAYGMKIEKLSAMIGMLGNAGIQGSMAGTQLAMGFVKVKDVFDAYGASTKRADGSTKDFVDALELLVDRGANADEVMAIFGQRSGRAALALMGQGIPALRAYIKEIEKAGGATKKLADIIRDTAKIDWKILISVLESVAIDIWEKYEESAVEALKTTVKWIGENREKIVELSKVVGNLAETMETVLIPALNKIWGIILYDPAILEWGLVGLALGGRKGAAIGAALGHMMVWVDNLSKALALVSTGILRLSDVANANFKELQDLVKKFEIPDPLKDLQVRAGELRQEIEYLRKATEGKIFVFAGDKERLIGLRGELEKVQAYIETLEKAKTLEVISDKAINQAERLGQALKDPAKYYDVSKQKQETYRQTEEMKKIYAKYYAALAEMEENADIEAIMRERERLEELKPIIAKRHEMWLSAYEAEENRLDEYASYRTEQEKSIAEQIRSIRMKDKTFALAALKEKYENYKNFTDDLVGLELWRATEEKKLTEDKYGDMTNAMMGWANNFSSTLNDMLWGAEITFKSILESFMKMITQMMIQMAIIDPLVAGITGGGIWKGITGLFSGLFSAQGNVFSQSGLQNFAQGGIVHKPTQFAFAGGVGLMGEAGPEAIMPLTRTPRGDLGVKTVNGPSDRPQKQTINVILNNPVFQDLETQRQVMAQIASTVAAQVAPGAVVENFLNDGEIRQMVRGGM